MLSEGKAKPPALEEGSLAEGDKKTKHKSHKKHNHKHKKNKKSTSEDSESVPSSEAAQSLVQATESKQET